MTLGIVLAVIILIPVVERVTRTPLVANAVGLIYAAVVGARREPAQIDALYGMKVYVTDRDLKGFGIDQSAITFGQIVVIERVWWATQLEYHEEGHVKQYVELTTFVFLVKYAFYWIVKTVKRGKDSWWGYHPIEREADDHMYRRMGYDGY